MTDHKTPPSIDFLSRLRRIDDRGLKLRDVIVLWAIAREHGMMGKEIAMKLGYKSRSNVQDCFKRLEQHGYIEDRRPVRNQITASDFHVLQKGNDFLAEIVPV